MKTIRRISLFFAVALASFGQEGTKGADVRKMLEDHGVSFGMMYVAEGFTTGPAGDYRGSLSTTLRVDLKQTGFGRGKIFVSAQDLHGRGVNDRFVGAIQAPSNLEEDRFRKAGEAWYTDSYFDERLRIKAGRQYADSDFGAVESSGGFLNAGFGAIPTAPMPTYPDPQLGVTFWTAPTRNLEIGVGAYRGGTLSTKKMFSVIESKIESSPQSVYRFGCWRLGANRGLYMAAEHRFGSSTNPSRPAVFARCGWAPRGKNEINYYTSAGFVYREVGIGMTSVHPVARPTEMVYELFLSHRLRENITLQPDLQWVLNPAGRGSNLVAGLRLTIQL